MHLAVESVAGLFGNKTRNLNDSKIPLKAILNRVHPLERFAYGKITIASAPPKHANDRPHDKVIVEVSARANSQPRCGGCGQPRPIYDTRRDERLFDFIPLFGMSVVFAYRMRRVDCRMCGGVKTEHVPWADGKEQMTTAYKWFLSTRARRMSWSETASVFRTSWNRVCRSIHFAVQWGLAPRETSQFTAIGIDEIASHRGHRYLTLVYQIDEGARRLLWVGRDRKE